MIVGWRAATTMATDLVMTPLRIAWHPPQRDGRRAVRFRDLLMLGDPRDPPAWRQQWTYRRHPDRCSVVVGEPATLSDLRRRWREMSGSDAALTTSFFHAPYVEMLMVAAAARRSGVGLALLGHCTMLVGDGEKLWSSTNRSNAPMQALFARAGFMPSGIVENLDEGDPELIYLYRR